MGSITEHILKLNEKEVPVDIEMSDTHISMVVGGTSLSFSVHKGEIWQWVYDINQGKMLSACPVHQLGTSLPENLQKLVDKK